MIAEILSPFPSLPGTIGAPEVHVHGERELPRVMKRTRRGARKGERAKERASCCSLDFLRRAH